jgi:predicted nucleic-acid-binding protein
MKGIDTNVLLRYFLRDDPVQSPIAYELLNQMISKQESCLINNIVLCEAIWTLESAFKYNKQAIIGFLQLILQADFFDFEDRETIHTSLNDYRASRADFSDCLIGRKNKVLGCTETASFDRGTKELSSFHVL